MMRNNIRIMDVILNVCGAFYGLLCLFSIVTGLMYALGGRELNPIELPDAFVDKISDSGKLKKFTRTMGWVTFLVGIMQGITSFAILKRGKKLHHHIALGFTGFSLCSAAYKIRSKYSLFAFLKTIAYTSIGEILLLPETGKLFDDHK